MYNVAHCFGLSSKVRNTCNMFSSYTHNLRDHPAEEMEIIVSADDANNDYEDTNTVATEIIDEVPYHLRFGTLERHHLAHSFHARLAPRRSQHADWNDDYGQDDESLETDDNDDGDDSRSEMTRREMSLPKVNVYTICGILLLVCGVVVMLDIQANDILALVQRICFRGSYVAKRALCSTGPTALVANHAQRALSSLAVDFDGQGHRHLCTSEYPCAPDPITGSIQHCTKNNTFGWWVSVTDTYFMEEYIANNIACE